MENLSQENLYLIFLPTLVPSIIGCSISMLFYFFAKSLRNYAFTLVTWLNFSDFIRAVSMIVMLIEPDSLEYCRYLGSIFFYSIFSCYFWTLTIAVTIYQDLILHKQNLERFYTHWLCFNNFFGVLFALIPLIFNEYGTDQDFCIISESVTGNFFLILFIFLVYLPIFSIILALYLIIYCKLKQFAGVNEENIISVKKLVIFPLIFVVCTLPITVREVLRPFGFNCIYFIIFANIMWSLHGLFDVFAYAFTDQFRGYLKSLCNRSKISYQQFIDLN